MAGVIQNVNVVHNAEHTYSIAGNRVAEFAIGEIGSPDDFFLIGVRPPNNIETPILSGNILDSEGTLICKIVKNNIIYNNHTTYKTSADGIGYEIRDSLKNLILKVETKYEPIPGSMEKHLVTTLTTNLYDKNGKLVFVANSGNEPERIEAGTKMLLGIGGICIGYSDEDYQLIQKIIWNGGKIYEPIRGEIVGKTIEMDGKLLQDVRFKDCTLVVRKGDFASIGRVGATNCKYDFREEAHNIIALFKLFTTEK